MTTTTATTSSHVPTQPAVAGSRARGRSLALAGAVGAALCAWAVAVPLLGVDLRVQPGGDEVRPVGIGAVAAASLVPGVAGWALLALLERRISRARRVWTGLAAAVLLLSLAGPVAAALTASAAVTLAGMHLLVGGVLIAGLRRTSPPAGSGTAA